MVAFSHRGKEKKKHRSLASRSTDSAKLFDFEFENLHIYKQKFFFDAYQGEIDKIQLYILLIQAFWVSIAVFVTSRENGKNKYTCCGLADLSKKKTVLQAISPWISETYGIWCEAWGLVNKTSELHAVTTPTFITAKIHQ